MFTSLFLWIRNPVEMNSGNCATDLSSPRALDEGLSLPNAPIKQMESIDRPSSLANKRSEESDSYRLLIQLL